MFVTTSSMATTELTPSLLARDPQVCEMLHNVVCVPGVRGEHDPDNRRPPLPRLSDGVPALRRVQPAGVRVFHLRPLLRPDNDQVVRALLVGRRPDGLHRRRRRKVHRRALPVRWLLLGLLVVLPGMRDVQRSFLGVQPLHSRPDAQGHHLPTSRPSDSRPECDIEHCATCSQTSYECVACDSDYVLKDGACHPPCGGNHCRECSDDICTLCDLGYGLNDDSQCNRLVLRRTNPQRVRRRRP